MKTLADFYNDAVALMEQNPVYFGHGTDNPHDEAWWLIAASLNLDIAGEFPHDRNLAQTELQILESRLEKRLKERVPLAYLLKEAYQNGYKFYVDERVLIPRSPIAELIAHHFTPWSESQKVRRILDLCTGSGCLAILAAHAYEAAQIDAIDLSSDALEVARKNLNPHRLQDRVRLIQSDVFTSLTGERYDIILSNPPYVDQEDINSMPDEYHHEPKMALAAGEDGLFIVHQILAYAKKHLNPGGILVVEVGNSEMALSEAYPNLPFVWLEFEHGGSGVFLLRESDL